MGPSVITDGDKLSFLNSTINYWNHLAAIQKNEFQIHLMKLGREVLSLQKWNYSIEVKLNLYYKTDNRFAKLRVVLLKAINVAMLHTRAYYYNQFIIILLV